MKIKVTKQDILKGKRSSPVSCPIARAVRRAGKRRVRVYVTQIVCRSGRFDLPEIAKRFIDNFDRTTTRQQRAAMRPFIFTLA